MTDGSPFKLARVLPLLAPHAAAYLERQVTEPSRPDYCAYLRADWGIDDAGATAGLVALCLWLHGVRRLHPDLVPPDPDDATLLARAAIAAEYLLRVQRPSGLTDLRDCNYDSSPDAGFILQSLCPAIELGRRFADDPGWGALQEKVERFARKMVGGAAAGGFHTPNHRWVIASALAQAEALFPDADVRPTIAAYLAEGFDIDADGAWTERSAAVYDAICDRSLLLLSERLDCPEARAAAVANLRMDLCLLDADGAIETGLSRRQDYGTRVVPSSLVVPYLLAGIAERDARLVGAAEFLWGAAPGQRDAYGVSQVLLSHGEPPDGIPFGDDLACHLAANGLWRVRRGPLSASAFSGATRLMRIRFGAAEIGSVKVSQSYFGVGRFVADAMTPVPDGVRLVSEGRSSAYRPGYEMPLGRRVTTDGWQETRAERELRRLPPPRSELTIAEAPGGFDLRYRTLEGMAGVPAQVALDFAPGGTWETADCSFQPVAGQVVFLRQGAGRMRYGLDTIRIRPGADGHRMCSMRDTEAAPGQVRVLVALITPVDHTLEVRCAREAT